MSQAITAQETSPFIKQFTCNNCGAALQAINPRAKYVCCHQCSSISDAQSEEHKVLTKLAKDPLHNKPFSFIKVGQKAIFHGKDYLVIARTRWRMDYQEYWKEEGDSGYSKEIWYFDEWLLISAADFTYFYLIEDREGYSVSKEIIPETPSLMPKDRYMSLLKGQSRKRVREFGKANVEYFEGESNYQISLGDEIQFAMYKHRNIAYSAEWRIANGQGASQIKEVEFFQEIPLARKDVVNAFNQNPGIDTMDQKEDKWRLVYHLSLVACLIFFGLMLFSFFHDGETVFQQDINFSPSADTSPDIITHPIHLQESGLYDLEMEISRITSNTEAYAIAYILDSSKVAVNKLEKTFSLYQGYEGGEHWREADLNTHQIFRLTKPQTYYVQLYMQQVDTYAQNKAIIHIRMHKDIWMSRYFVIALILSFIVYIIAYGKKDSRW